LWEKLSENVARGKNKEARITSDMDFIFSFEKTSLELKKNKKNLTKGQQVQVNEPIRPIKKKVISARGIPT
jgi:hypothetical protein